MLALTGQTAGPNRLNFFWKPMGARGVRQPKKMSDFFNQRSIFFQNSKIYTDTAGHFIQL